MPRKEKTTTGSSVKNRIKALRKERGLTQEALADLVGVSRQTVNAIETDRHDPSLALAFGIARAFDEGIESIFTPAEEASASPAKTSRATRRPRR